MTDEEIEVIIDGWLFGFQRSLIRARGDLQFDMWVAGIYNRSNHDINPMKAAR